ncbi:hypothetical protein E2E30_03045 [Sphingomonas sp. AAP5]|uniref:hypothetical protein n=1 Tax=Sphingomonas sp. AAP5 TaxID=1523415 RepID=UPI00105725E9|nr:hypothetical protein [Sphingomonas sp. AAP5]QBM74845.1 hypothetical protein E2E30_03045 [Sphingomonas sp. AAP5]
MIEAVSADVVLATARKTLGLDADHASGLDDTYLAAVLRRLAGFLCPCSPKTLVRSVIDSHRALVPDDTEFADRVGEMVEALTAVGDLLELGEVSVGGEGIKGTWLFAAPPSFVARESGSVFLLGLSADEATPLPTEMRSRIAARGASRTISPQLGEELAATLRDLGMRELSAAAWRRAPKVETAEKLVANYDDRLSVQRSSGEIPDLLVLDGTRRTRSYRARWVAPQAQSGNFIVRRPQAYGADLWGYAELQSGLPRKLIDLPLPGGRWRGCDVAWRIQMALDAIAGRPQEYRLTGVAGGTRIDFYSPIPDWARRRLSAVGEEITPEGCLMSFVVNDDEIGAEERFVRELLFLTRATD